MMSANQNGEPVRWCLLAKFLEYCRLDKDLCSVDIEKDRVVLTLPKSEASHGLWHRIYIGTSENSLKEMFFMTDHSMSELLGRLHQEENPWAKSSVDITPGEGEEESDALTRRLERLLREQDAKFAEDASTSVDEVGDNAQECSGLSNVGEDTDEKVFQLRKEDKKKSSEETSSTSSDIAVDMTLDELQDDVILESNASAVSAEGLSRLPIERSNSDESVIGCNRKLRSILKRSQSESANGFYGHGGYKVGGDNSNKAFQKLSKTRIRSQSLNVDTCSLPQAQMGRFRNKSVSFDPEPQVCEFVEYSKKQLKKMRKQERKQTELAAKKVEAAAKKAAGKSKGLKSGKNMHFFNGFRRDSSKSDESDTDKDSPGEKPSGSAAMESTANDLKQNVSTSDSVKKSSRKSKTKKNAERKDERTLARENRTNSSDEHLTNSLIYELDD